MGYISGFSVRRRTVPYYDEKEEKETSLTTAEQEVLATVEPTYEIDFSDKDEKKKQIEKLIKEKPDIVVQIIRTWLNEE